MKLKIIRNDGNGITITSDKLGLVMVFQNTTSAEHRKIMKDLELVFPDADVLDIFYDYKNASIFIFDCELTELTKEDKNCISNAVANGGKRKYAIVLHGKVEKGSTLNQLAIRETKHGIYISKQFTTLLTMSQGNLTD
jgi:hypothetical protein